jgi:hypothetical protein
MAADTNGQQAAFAKMLKTMLKPLVRLLLQRGVTYTALLEPLKQIFVEVADESFQLEYKRQTDSRISLLTGVHRKEVKRLRETYLAEAVEQPEIKASLSSAMMAKWLSDPAYLTADGQPKALTRTGENSFESLVFSISKDKHPRSVLDDWLHQKIVVIDDQQLIHLQIQGFVPSENEAEKLFFAGKNISEHLEVVTHNLTHTDHLQFDRAVYYARLSQDSIAQLNSLAKEKSLALLTDINQTAYALQQKDSQTPETATEHFHVGCYISHHPLQSDKQRDDA